MTAPTRYRPTAPDTGLERLVVALLYVVVLLPVAGVILMLIAGGTLFGFELGALGEVPGWMALWVLLGAVLFALVGVWGVRMFAEWMSSSRS